MKKFAVFDIDGTLIRWQLYHAVINKLAKEGHLGDIAYETIREARAQWKRRVHAEAFHEYQMKVIDLFLEQVTNVPLSAYDNAIEKTLYEHRDQTYVYTRTLLEDLKQKGYLLFAISGSNKEIVARLAEYYGFDDFVGTLHEQKEGRFTGKVSVGMFDKNISLQTMVDRHKATLKGSIGVGDSKSDAAILEMVENPIAFNPEQALVKIAQKHGWKIVIERKNVVYELELKDGTYVLAETKN